MDVAPTGLPSTPGPPRAPGRPDRGAGHYLRDLVYGALDGVVTTLAVVAGVEGADFPARVAVTLGIANIVADGISMGASNYLGLKSELQQTGGSVAREQPVRHALATFGAFAVAGAVPLLAFALPRPAGVSTLAFSAALSAITLLAAGAARGPFTGQPRWISAAEMAAIGGVAAGAAFAVGLLARA